MLSSIILATSHSYIAQIFMDNFLELKHFLASPKYVVITSHRNPDGDAIGSSLALAHFLNKLGHTTRVIVPSEYPNFLAWMTGANDIVIYDNSPETGNEYLNNAEIVFCLDFNSLDRIDKLGTAISNLDVRIAMIDHHLYPENFAEFMMSDPSASSTSEMIMDFIQMMEGTKELDVTIGESMMTGILTDTGSFKYSTSPKLLRIVADLLEIGVDNVKLQDLIFNSMEEKHLRLLGHCLNNRLEILPEFNTGIIYLTKKDYEDFKIQRGDTEGIVNFLLKVKNVKVAAFITEQPTIVKISLRSKGDFSVQEICQKHFKGGGHLNASGGASHKSLSATIQQFKDLLPDYQNQLINN